MIIVEFLANAMPYMRGECAGFSPEIADQLIRRGLAKRVTVPAKTCAIPLDPTPKRATQFIIPVPEEAEDA